MLESFGHELGMPPNMPGASTTPALGYVATIVIRHGDSRERAAPCPLLKEAARPQVHEAAQLLGPIHFDRSACGFFIDEDY